ncbi:MAG: STAS domain-containing protein [Deltaproteobacteria bacterium]|nr:MAG: STAS domain-containing protein [Deltaproteobacteria bacterium]
MQESPESTTAILRLDLLRRYKLSWLPGDLISGIIIFAVTIPCAVAYSQLAGLAPINGLYASLLAMVIYPLLGTSRQVVVDAEDTVAILVASSLGLLAAGADPNRYLALAMMQAILVGAILFVAGTARAGFIADFIPKTIITGFLNGMALIMIASQLGKMTGVHLENPDFFPRLWEFYTKINQVNQLILIVGIACLAALLVIRYQFPKIPEAILVVVLATAAAIWWNLGDRGIELVGVVPAGLPQPKIPDVGFNDILNLIPFSAGIALIAFFDVMSTARAFAFRNRYEIDPNQDMIALGVANVGSGFFQGFGCGCSQSRSAINSIYGGQSQFASLFAGGLLALFLLYFTYILKDVPVAALTAIIVMAAINLFNPGVILEAWRTRPASAYLSIITTVAVLVTGLMTGILVAVALAIILVLHRLTRPHEIVTRPPIVPGLMIYRFGAPLFFFNAVHFASRIQNLILAARPQVSFFLINAEAIVEMDVNAAEKIEELYDDLKSRGIVLGICNAKGHFRKVLLNTGLPNRDGFNLYPTIASVLEELTKKQLEVEALEVAEAKRALEEAEKAVNQTIEETVKEAVKQVFEMEEQQEQEDDEVAIKQEVKEIDEKKEIGPTYEEAVKEALKQALESDGEEDKIKKAAEEGKTKKD